MHQSVPVTVRHAFLCGIVVALSLISGCGPKKHSTEIYHISDEASSTFAVSSIMMVVPDDRRDYIDWIAIDDLRIDHDNYGEVRVAPGSYRIEWERKFNISAMINPSGSHTQNWRTDLLLEAGHIYTVHAKRTIGQGYQIYSWITDDTVDEVIWGREYVPGPYDYLAN